MDNSLVQELGHAYLLFTIEGDEAAALSILRKTIQHHVESTVMMIEKRRRHCCFVNVHPLKENLIIM